MSMYNFIMLKFMYISWHIDKLKKRISLVRCTRLSGSFASE